MLKEVQPIASRLAAADRSMQREKAGSLLFRSIKIFLALVVLLFALDVFLHLDASQRVGLLIGLGVAVLVFVGGKMLLAGFYKIPTLTSLLVIVGILAVAVVASLLHARSRRTKVEPPLPTEADAR